MMMTTYYALSLLNPSPELDNVKVKLRTEIYFKIENEALIFLEINTFAFIHNGRLNIFIGVFSEMNKKAFKI